MTRHHFLHDLKRSNCKTEWNDLSGTDDRMRSCPRCESNICKLDGLAPSEAESLVKSSALFSHNQNNLRFRNDGTILVHNRDCRFDCGRRILRALEASLSPSLFASMALLTTCYLFWDGMDLLTPFLFPLLAAGAWIVFGTVFIGALVKACKARGTLVWRFRFVLLDVFTLLTAVFFPFVAVNLWVDFNFNMPARNAMIRLAEQGKLERPYSYNRSLCLLPLWSRYLSKGGGDVVISASNDPNHLHIFFFTYRGILARHSGFEYSADDKPPQDAAEAREIQHLRTHWYWATY
jgi:hypothetical protein